MRTGKERIRGILAGMKKRCNNPSDRAYRYYGGRGIKVCEEWSHGSRAFVEWALKNGYRDDLSIDRIDNSKGYEPSNCRWATSKEQANNHLYNNRVIAFGMDLTTQEWADLIGLDRKTLRVRLKNGMTPEEAVTHPLMKNGEIYKRLKPIENVISQEHFNSFVRKNLERYNITQVALSEAIGVNVKSKLSNSSKWTDWQMDMIYEYFGKKSFMSTRSKSLVEANKA